MRRLPPLGAVEAFVQVGRLGSLKAAAEALALSAPALSRRIQSLERHVGHDLFERRHQAVRLNGEGERLMAEIAPALDSLALAVERAGGDGAPMRLRLGVPPLFAAQRLMPSLSALRDRHPGLHIDIDTGAHGLARLGDGLDAAIVVAAGVEPPLHGRRLGEDRLVAIGARHLAEGPEALSDPSDLGRFTILLHRDLPGAWDYWREAIGRPELEPGAIDHFDSGQLILDAAARGLGIAFMLESHLREARDPRLAALFGIAAASPYHYWFACRRPALNRRPVRIFHDWLVEREAA
jgi:LysR family glycine cleavage system transcriptional activator